ncbi:MAG TPA: hypothetical protein VGL06_07070 [Pseudonocardiaceae bacterium]
MHPIVFLFLLALLLTFGPYVLSILLCVAVLVAFVVGTIEYATASISGFTPLGEIAHLHMDPPAESAKGPDPAYRSYFAGPILLDYYKVLTTTIGQVWTKVVMSKTKDSGPAQMSLVDRVWRWMKRSAVPRLLSVPAAAAATVGLLIGVVGALGFVGVVSMVFALLLALFALGAVALGAGGQLFELGVLFVRGITVECGVCHTRATRPVYQCPNCGAAHRRLLPGRSGILRRTCRCQQSLPTLLARGKAQLPAYCGECDAQLPIKALRAPTVHIPVIAGPAAGKSVFMQTAVTRLMMLDNGFEFADQTAKAQFEDNLRRGVVDAPDLMVKTVVAPVRAYNVFVGKEGSRARRLLYLYDPAGELPENVESLSDLHFLQFAKGVVFVVDPFALRQVRSTIDRATLGKLRASNTPPHEILERFVEALRERMPSDRSGRFDVPVSVVLTKSDGLLNLSGVAHPYVGLGPSSRSERDLAVRNWISTMGQGDMVSSLDNNFTRVSFFAVSYQDARDVFERRSFDQSVTNDDPAEPLLWLLRKKEQR